MSRDIWTQPPWYAQTADLLGQGKAAIERELGSPVGIPAFRVELDRIKLKCGRVTGAEIQVERVLEDTRSTFFVPAGLFKMIRSPSFGKSWEMANNKRALPGTINSLLRRTHAFRDSRGEPLGVDQFSIDTRARMPCRFGRFSVPAVRKPLAFPADRSRADQQRVQTFRAQFHA